MTTTTTNKRVLTQGESVNVSSTYHSGGGYILWKLTLADAPNLAFLIEPLYSYFYDGSHLVFGYGHDPNTNSSRTWNVTYRDGYYYSYQSGAHEKHLLNSSDMFIEYQYSTYAYDYFEFQITAVEARDYMYCDSEPTTEVSLRTAQCDGVADCMNSNDEYIVGGTLESPIGTLNIGQQGAWNNPISGLQHLPEGNDLDLTRDTTSSSNFLGHTYSDFIMKAASTDVTASIEPSSSFKDNEGAEGDGATFPDQNPDDFRQNTSKRSPSQSGPSQRNMTVQDKSHVGRAQGGLRNDEEQLPADPRAGLTYENRDMWRPRGRQYHRK
eukprot:XP_011664335.1 PREDICTED: uncharacterized protein LOC105438334 [Strongylocentrotus purpuratus]